MEGQLLLREEETYKQKFKTGKIEVQVEKVTIINESKTPPFAIADDAEVSEEIRLKYRYLDLRRPVMFETLKMRHRVTKAIRRLS